MISLQHIPDYKKGTGMVYSIMCVSTARMYIGCTQTNRRRIESHFSQLRIGTHDNKQLQSDFDFFGEQDFVVYIITAMKGSHNRLRSNLLAREAEAIIALKPYYNTCLKGMNKQETIAA